MSEGKPRLHFPKPGTQRCEHCGIRLDPWGDVWVDLIEGDSRCPSPGNEQRAQMIKFYEYCVVYGDHLYAAGGSLQDRLNDYGADGWLLVGVTPSDSYVFCREISMDDAIRNREQLRRTER